MHRWCVFAWTYHWMAWKRRCTHVWDVPEHISQTIVECANERQITLIYSTKQAHTKRLCRTTQSYGYKWMVGFAYIWICWIAQKLATEWLWVYNNMRPHSAICRVLSIFDWDRPIFCFFDEPKNWKMTVTSNPTKKAAPCVRPQLHILNKFIRVKYGAQEYTWIFFFLRKRFVD